MATYSGKWKHLLEDPKLRLWYQNYRNRSVVAAEIHFRSLGLFSLWLQKRRRGETLSDYSKLPIDEMEDIAQAYVNEMQSRKNPKSGKAYSGGYVDNGLTAIKNWAEFNHKRFQRKINVKDSSKTPTLEEERAPEREELKRVLYADTTSLRTRVSIALTAFSGIRLETQGDYEGTDGLMIKDFPEMEISKEVSFKQFPTYIVVRESISKSRREYRTLLPEEGCALLKEYLERRIKDGEELKPSSCIISTRERDAWRSKSFGYVDKAPFLVRSKISDGIRQAMRTVGLPFRPYVWRVYFDTAMLEADLKGMISHAIQQFLMGHVGDIEATYTTNKKRLPPNLVEEIRQRYKKVAEEILETTRQKKPEIDYQRILREQLLLAAGLSQEALSKIDLSGMSQEDFQKLLREKLTGLALNNGNKQKVVPVGQIEDLINQGFEFVAPLGGDRAIVRIPSL